MLLAQLSRAGRAESNEILWCLLTDWALRPEYEDLSNKVTHVVYQARQRLDRPPERHFDRGTWSWEKYYEPRKPQWDPWAPPPAYTLRTGPGGEPLPPPLCWGEPTQ